MKGGIRYRHAGSNGMLISVHLPKTAGSSFVSALEHYFGEHLLKDYADLPMNRSTPRRNFSAVRNALVLPGKGAVSSDIRCIHGHYMPVKYRLVRPKTPKVYVTWMRDPVERSIGWGRKIAQPESTGVFGPNRKDLLAELLQFKQYLSGKNPQNSADSTHGI